MTWPHAKLNFVARFGYGDAVRTDEVQEGPFRVFGSNGPYASFNRPNTRAPAIVVGRKGSYGKVNWTPEPCFASDTTFFIDSSTSRHDPAGSIGYSRRCALTKVRMKPPFRG